MKLFLASLLFLSFQAQASDVKIVKIKASQKSDKSWSFSVTLKHNDTGWDHYANGWRVEDNKGNVLGTRELAHPHVDEQPFTRSLSGVKIKSSITKVYIRASDSTTGWEDEVSSFTL